MAYEKQHWQDALQAAKSKGGGQDDRADQREQKKKSRLMFRKRKLDKEVRQYIKDKDIIRYGKINEIGNRHGFRLYDLGPRIEGDRE